MRRQMSGDQHYNLARSVQAGRRFAAHLCQCEEQAPAARDSIWHRAR